MKRVRVPQSPQELQEALVVIFPSFAAALHEPPDSDFESEPPTFHSLMRDFTCFFGKEVGSFLTSSSRSSQNCSPAPSSTAVYSKTQCLRAFSSTLDKSKSTGSWRHRWPRHVRSVAPNPSIERTSSSRLRLLPAAAHVKLQGLPHLSSGTDPS
jgi:hypothetical protein